MRQGFRENLRKSGYCPTQGDSAIGMSEYPLGDSESAARDGIIEDSLFGDDQGSQASSLYDTSDHLAPSMVQPDDSTQGPKVDHDIQKTDCPDFQGELSSDLGGDSDSIDSMESLYTTHTGDSLDLPMHPGVSLVIQNVNLNLTNWIKSKLGVSQNTNGEAGSSHGYATDHIHTSTSALTHNSFGKRMRPPDGEDDDGSENSRGGGGRGNKRPECEKEEETTGPMFACPYFKESPESFRNQTTCVGPGWRSISRLKYVSTQYHKLTMLTIIAKGALEPPTL